MSERDCPAEVRRGRMEKAAGFLLAANGIATLDDGEGSVRDAVVTLYVHAGIAAADVICCARLGRHSSGENHNEATGLLRQADPTSAPRLNALLGMKTRAGYSHRAATEADVRRATRAATQLVEAARAAVSGR